MSNTYMGINLVLFTLVSIYSDVHFNVNEFANIHFY